MTCPECGGPLDPDVTHPQHHPDCTALERPQPDDDWLCDCPEVCSDCCTDAHCVLRDNQAPDVMWACVFEPEERGMTNAVVKYP